jgi:hypothetical protein
MIDSEARHKAAAVLRMFAAREITNDELERRWPSGKDNALEGIRLAIWYVYDDLSEHRHHSDPEADDLLSRCADFLNTNAEHRWPLPRRWLILASLPLSILTFGLANRLFWRKYDFPAHWPFDTQSAREAARHQPRKVRS